MEALELLDIISLGETSTVQFKRTLDSTDKLAAELCAFANSEGGMVLFGVENDGSISGLEPSEVRELNSRIASVASEKIREPLFPSSEVVKIEGKNVLLVSVPESESKPHFDGSGAIWVKNMAEKRRVTSREELRRIFQDAHVFYADEQPVRRTSLADLDRIAFRDFYEKEYGQLEQETTPLVRILANMNVARKENLTLAGLLFFGKHPERFRPELMTKAVAFPGTDSADSKYLDSEDLSGTLPQQLSKSKSFVLRNLRREQGDQPFNTEGIPEIPPEALEELLVNMLVHRNYFVATPQKIFLFQDRIELHSPGTLPNALTVEQVKAGNSIPRNPILHALASKLMPYRGIGTGIRRALKLYSDIELFNEEQENLFRVIIQRPK